MTIALGVGIIGGGPVTQAIHLPTLARLTQHYRVVAIMDVVESVSTTVAMRAGAKSATSVEEIMADPEVEVVAICSPPQFHAEQVEAAIVAGKKAILCEKPFAVSREEAQHLAAIAQESGVPIVIGAMHTHDSAWLVARESWGDLGETAHTVHSSIDLPMNPRYEDWATEVHSRAGAETAQERSDSGYQEPDGRWWSEDSPADSLRDAVLGLIVHNLPMVRTFVPTIESLDLAKVFDPFGYVITLHGEGRLVELFGHMHNQWLPRWTFDVWGASNALHIDFPPSFVHAGGATATIYDAKGSRTFGPYAQNGYEREWLQLAEFARGKPQPPEDLHRVIDDLTYAVEVAERAVAALKTGAAV